MVAFDGYHQGAPNIAKISITTFANARAAWAELMRDKVDMLYEADAEAMEFFKDSKTVSVYTFDRPYQYVMFLNTRSPKLKAPDVRRGLNEAIDRKALIQEALRGHGTPSVGPVSPHHWAFQEVNSTFAYAPRDAASKLPAAMKLRCVTLAEAPFEQIALVVKRQLREVGVDLEIEAAPVEQVFSTLTKNEFEAVLLDSISGWSLMRAYRWWHSQSPQNASHFSSPKVDLALDRARRSITDDEYKSAVGDFERAIAEDPPAVFLAWGERSRAVSNRFDVKPQQGRDVLATLRLWRPTTDKVNATHD